MFFATVARFRVFCDGSWEVLFATVVGVFCDGPGRRACFLRQLAMFFASVRCVFCVGGVFCDANPFFCDGWRGPTAVLLPVQPMFFATMARACVASENHVFCNGSAFCVVVVPVAVAVVVVVVVVVVVLVVVVVVVVVVLVVVVVVVVVLVVVVEVVVVVGS